MIRAAASALLLAPCLFASDLAVTDVSARSRFPWEGKVDVSFSLSHTNVSERLAVALSARDDGTGREFPVRTLLLDGAAAPDPRLPPGRHTLTWDAQADLGGICVSSLVCTVTAQVRRPLPDAPYLVIDVSGGEHAASYPVAAYDDVPAAGWASWQVVLRRVAPGSFSMGSPAAEVGRAYAPSLGEQLHRVTLTRAFHIGVFEVTQGQWEQVMGDRPGYFRAWPFYSSRPVEQVSYDMIRGSGRGACWPASPDVDETSFVGRLRARTGLLSADLPTEAQWEYACRAGTGTALNDGSDLSSAVVDSALAGLGRYMGNVARNYNEDSLPDAGTEYVGEYRPNAWGLYDMHGNVQEWCLDWAEEDFSPWSATDPCGPASGSGRVLRGGAWRSDAWACRSASRTSAAPSTRSSTAGFRLCLAAGERFVASARGDAMALSLDLRAGARDAVESVPVSFSTDWAPGATGLEVRAGEEVLLSSSTPTNGVLAWRPDFSSPGTVTLRHAFLGAAAEPLEATFVVANHEVVFDPGELGELADGGLRRQVVPHGGAAVPPVVTPRDGYAFAGWSAGTESVTRDLRVTAQYELVRYAVDYQDLHGAVNTNPVSYTVLDRVVFAPPGTAARHRFLRWEPSEIPAGTSGDFVVRAVWEETPFVYVGWTGADDRKDGSLPDVPVATLGRAYELAEPGDTIVVAPRTYGCVTARGKAVTFLAPERGAVIDGYLRNRCVTADDGVRFVNFTFMDGVSGESGGGVFGGVYDRCTIRSCIAQLDGGGAYGAELRNCLLVDNVSRTGRGGGASGGRLVNCTVVANRAVEGGGVHAPAVLANTLVWGNRANQAGTDEGMETESAAGAGNLIGGEPLLRDVAGGDLRPQAFSPCRDAGDDAWTAGSLDRNGLPRSYGAHVDVGAYELQHEDLELVPGGSLRYAPSGGATGYDVPCDWLVASGVGRYGEEFDAVLPRLEQASAAYPGYTAWEAFVAGLSADEPVFRASVEMTAEGEPSVSWSPNLNTGAVQRIYRVKGCTSLEAADWTWPADARTHRFFKVVVSMPGAGEVSDEPGVVQRTDPPYCPHYLVIDLSAGPGAAVYPVAELDAKPEGGWTDEYKTEKLVLQEIHPGSFSPYGAGQEVVLTRSYHIGVFEVTQRQWELVMGDRPSFFSADASYAARPVETVSYDDIRGMDAGSGWPASSDVDPTSFVGRLRARTGLATLDLPTEMQWVFACYCRAGESGAIYDPCPWTRVEGEVGRYWWSGGEGGLANPSSGPESGTAPVGSYAPNDWGLYDMFGNVWEWCLDWWGAGPTDAVCVDPVGAASGDDRVVLGGGWLNDLGDDAYCGDAPSSANANFGFRLCLH